MSDPATLVVFRGAPAGLRRSALETFARHLQDRVAAGREFLCLITGDAELQRLNRQFLGKNYATDVLSFPAVIGGRGATGPLGEMAISGDRAADQARALGHSIDDEIRILMLHGVLHLLGMDHERDRGAMERAETRWRKQLGLPLGLIERMRA
jgi:probable rRNA maturation factor